jgi:23S rRNA (cytidine2498-2'-O)-methyltransferase
MDKSHFKFAYLAPLKLEAELEAELKSIYPQEPYHQHGRLFFTKKDLQIFWCIDKWADITICEIQSVGSAVKTLKSVGKVWCNYSHINHRRGHLIEEQLPQFKPMQFAFGKKLPALKMGGYTLLEDGKLAYSPNKTSPFPNGEVPFIENKTDPPSRAYLKLWEALQFYSEVPQQGDRAIDFGACPGGWTWVLSNIGCQVTAIDRTEVAPELIKRSNVQFIKGDAFAIRAEDYRDIKWFCSDIICDPSKLFEFVTHWRSINKETCFICTLKFKGDADHELPRAMQNKLGGKIIHLYNNKHELTWISHPR